MKYAIITLMAAAPFLANAGTSIGVGYSQIDMETEAGSVTPDFKNRLLTTSLSYQPSENIKATLFAGVAVDEADINKQTDTFRPVSPPGEEIQSRTLRTTAELDYMAGMEISFVFPTTSHLSVQLDAGYLTAPWESSGYEPFIDNKPAEDYEQGLNEQLDDCQLTGNEDAHCGGLATFSEKGTVSGPYAGIALNWAISKKTSIVFSGKKSLSDSKGEFSTYGISVNFNW